MNHLLRGIADFTQLMVWKKIILFPKGVDYRSLPSPISLIGGKRNYSKMETKYLKGRTMLKIQCCASSTRRSINLKTGYLIKIRSLQQSPKTIVLQRAIQELIGK